MVGFSNGAQLAMSTVTDPRVLDQVTGVISQHGTPSGDYCGWDNPKADSKPGIALKRFKGWFHIGGVQDLDITLPTFCDTEDAGYCRSQDRAYIYSSAAGNLACWNRRLLLNSTIEAFNVSLNTGTPYSRGINPLMEQPTGTCIRLKGSHYMACRSHVDHKFDPYYTSQIVQYIQTLADISESDTGR